MFSKVNTTFYAFFVLSILLLSAVGCANRASQTEQSQPVLAVESSTETDGNATVKLEEDSQASDVEPLSLGPNVDVQTVASIMDRDDVFLLDVREQSEYDAGHIRGNTLIPTGTIADRISEIPKDKEVIIYCHSGARSSRVFQLLTEQGYTNVHNMVGGIVAWQGAGFEVE